MNPILKAKVKLFANKPRRARKASVKQQRVVDAIRQKILSGAYPTGSQIPIQTELVKEFQLSSVTVQEAVHELKRQGFLTAKRRLGTFIAEIPPHLNNYALVFPHDPLRSEVWGNFYESLRLEGQRINEAGVKNVGFYFGIEEFDRSEDYVRLVGLVRNQQISGIIFASPPVHLEATPLLTDPDMPRVAIGDGIGKFNIPFVRPRTSIAKAARHLAARGAKMIAFFSTVTEQIDEWLRTQPDLAGLGIGTREQWCFAISAAKPRTARNCTRLLMDLPEADRPDGIIVMDDHFTEAVEQGVLSAGDGAARQCKIISICNFPDRFSHQLPISRFGCEAGDILQACIEVIDQQRAGRKVQRQTFVDSHIED